MTGQEFSVWLRTDGMLEMLSVTTPSLSVAREWKAQIAREHELPRGDLVIRVRDVGEWRGEALPSVAGSAL